jgi:hypothetical protein
MERLLDLIAGWLRTLFDLITAATERAVSITNWPAHELGVPPEVFFIGMVCVAMLVLWRAMAIRWY